MRNYKREIKILEERLANTNHPIKRKNLLNEIDALKANQKARVVVFVVAVLSVVVGVVLAFGAKLSH